MEIFTIGHSNMGLDHFMKRLAMHEIQTIIDVRSNPWSRWCPHFNGKSLAKTLPGDGIDYHDLGELLGGKPGPEFLRVDGTPDYEGMAKREEFAQGLWLCRQAIHGGPVALMCSEGRPEKCHRHLLLAPGLERIGVGTIHILMDGNTVSAGEVTAAVPVQMGMAL